MIDQAIAFAAMAHAGQRRKYTGEPYVCHTIEVMQIILQQAEDLNDDMLIAALLHDVVEDTPVSLETIQRRFGTNVKVFVDDLTDKFTHEAYPEMNRAARKKAERERLGGVWAESQTIKLADMISNTKSIATHDPDFSVVYLREKRDLLPFLTRGDSNLMRLARHELAVGAQQAGVDLNR